MWASRARRCRETAEIVAAQVGRPLADATCDLCEMHPGEAEGLTFDEMRARFGPNYSFVPGAEYFPDWLPAAVERLRSLVAGYEGRTVVGFTHLAVVKAARASPSRTGHRRTSNRSRRPTRGSASGCGPDRR